MCRIHQWKRIGCLPSMIETFWNFQWLVDFLYNHLFFFFFCFINLDLNKFQFFYQKQWNFRFYYPFWIISPFLSPFFLKKKNKQNKFWHFIFDFYFLGIKLLESFIFLKAMFFNWFFIFQSFSENLSNCFFSFDSCEAEKLLSFNILADNVIF